MRTESEQLEQRARKTRARISESVEALRGRMTAGQIGDQLADYARGGPAADFFRNLGREVRQNPLPLTVIAIGVAWLILANIRSSRGHMACSAVKPTADDADRQELLGPTIVDQSASRRKDLVEMAVPAAPFGDEER
jgi:hypothetical protein